MNSSDVIPFTHELKEVPKCIYQCHGDNVSFDGNVPYILTKIQNKKKDSITFRIFKVGYEEFYLEFPSKRNLNVQFLESNKLLFISDDYFEIKRLKEDKNGKIELEMIFKIDYNQIGESKIGEKYLTRSGRPIVNRIDLQLERDPIQCHFFSEELNIIAILRSGIIYFYKYSNGELIREFKLLEETEMNFHNNIFLDDQYLVHLFVDEHNNQRCICYELLFK